MYSPPRARICRPCQGLASFTSSLGAGSDYILNLSCKAQGDWFWRHGDDENPRLPVKLVLEISWVNWKDPWKKCYWSQRPKVSSQRKGQKRGCPGWLDLWTHSVPNWTYSKETSEGESGLRCERRKIWMLCLTCYNETGGGLPVWPQARLEEEAAGPPWSAVIGEMGRAMENSELLTTTA